MFDKLVKASKDYIILIKSYDTGLKDTRNALLGVNRN